MATHAGAHVTAEDISSAQWQDQKWQVSWSTEGLERQCKRCKLVLAESQLYRVGSSPAFCMATATQLCTRVKAGDADLAKLHHTHEKGSQTACLLVVTLCCNASCLHELLQTSQ